MLEVDKKILNKHDMEIQGRLDAMPFTEARKAIKLGMLYTIDSPDHKVALSWLEGKQTELQEAREKKILLWSIISAIAAVSAAVLAFIGVLR